MKKNILKVLALLLTAALAFTVVHFAVLGNNTPVDTSFTFDVVDGSAVITGSPDALSGAVVLPAELGGHTVTAIGENAFSGCADVTAFFLPSTVTTIGNYAFENCSALSQAILPDGLTTIGDGAFWNCSSLVSVTVPVSVTAIGSCAFYKCNSMASLILPGVTTPAKGIFNVALDIGQTLKIGFPTHSAVDPVTTTLYCYNGSVAYVDSLNDSFCDVALLDDYTLTSYTVHAQDENGNTLCDDVTVNLQPSGITVAAVAPVIDNDELEYPEVSIQTLKLSDSGNVITFVYSEVVTTTESTTESTTETTTEEPTTEESTTEMVTEEPTTEEPTTEEPTTEQPTVPESTTVVEPTTEEPVTEPAPVPPVLYAKEGSGVTVDRVNHLVYGIDFETTPDVLKSKYLQVEGDGTMKVDTNFEVHTGSMIDVVDTEGNVVDSYTLIIFGDLNNDGLCNATDVVFLRSFIAGSMLKSDYPLGYFAADMNGDGLINATDVVYIRGIIAGSLDYNQATRSPRN